MKESFSKLISLLGRCCTSLISSLSNAGSEMSSLILRPSAFFDRLIVEGRVSHALYFVFLQSVLLGMCYALSHGIVSSVQHIFDQNYYSVPLAASALVLLCVPPLFIIGSLIIGVFCWVPFVVAQVIFTGVIWVVASATGAKSEFSKLLILVCYSETFALFGFAVSFLPTSIGPIGCQCLQVYALIVLSIALSKLFGSSVLKSAMVTIVSCMCVVVLFSSISLLPIVGNAAKATAAYEKEMNKSQALVGKIAPNIVLTPCEGKPIKLSSLKGKVVVLDFCATWCGPCCQWLPQLAEVSKDFSNKDVRFFVVDSTEPKEAITTLLTSKQIKIPAIIDSSGQVAKAFMVSGIPQTVIIDKKGIVEKIHVGFGPDEKKKVTDEIKAAI